MKNYQRKIVMLLLACIVTFSQNEIMARRIVLFGPEDPPHDENQEGYPHRSPSAIPIVEFENRLLSFYSYACILSMEITIKNHEGTIIYHNYLSITDGISSVELTEEECNSAYSIELEYADYHLIGFF